jgi:hypothetical protein
MGFQPEQAQWLVQFMRNLPGGAPEEASESEYARVMLQQREQAAQVPMPQHDFGGYEAPPFHPWPPPDDWQPPSW